MSIGVKIQCICWIYITDLLSHKIHISLTLMENGKGNLTSQLCMKVLLLHNLTDAGYSHPNIEGFHHYPFIIDA